MRCGVDLALTYEHTRGPNNWLQIPCSAHTILGLPGQGKETEVPKSYLYVEPFYCVSMGQIRCSKENVLMNKLH